MLVKQVDLKTHHTSKGVYEWKIFYHAEVDLRMRRITYPVQDCTFTGITCSTYFSFQSYFEAFDLYIIKYMYKVIMEEVFQKSKYRTSFPKTDT